MRLKNDVRLTDVTPQVAIGLQVCDSIYDSTAEFCTFTGDDKWDFTMVVTSINDGRHGKTSWHYRGRAWDLRVHNISNPMEVYEAIKTDLGEDFDVLLEGLGTDNAHIHCEYDPEVDIMDQKEFWVG